MLSEVAKVRPVEVMILLHTARYRQGLTRVCLERLMDAKRRSFYDGRGEGPTANTIQIGVRNLERYGYLTIEEHRDQKAVGSGSAIPVSYRLTGRGLEVLAEVIRNHEQDQINLLLYVPHRSKV